MMKAVWNGERTFLWTFVPFGLIGAFGSTIAFYGAFFILCAVECTALPWFAFIIGPAVTLFAILPLCVWLGVGSFRATKQLPAPRAMAARIVIGSSPLWLLIVSGTMFSVALKAMQSFT